MGHDHAGHRHEPLGLSGRALTAGLKLAEVRCGGPGPEADPPPAAGVLELLMKAGQPVKAYDLISGFSETAGEVAKPPTIYRALEFLEREGLAHRIESLSAYVACRGEPGDHAAALPDLRLLRQDRGDRRPGWTRPLRGLAGQAGYTIQTVAIEARGRCAACREEPASHSHHEAHA